MNRRTFISALLIVPAALASLAQRAAASDRNWSYPPWNVKHWSARGDGIHDDGPALQKTIDWVLAHRQGGVFLPAGTYRGLRTRWPQDVSLIGESPKTTAVDWSLLLPVT